MAEKIQEAEIVAATARLPAVRVHGLGGSTRVPRLLALEAMPMPVRVSLQCWHLSVSVLTLECFCVGTLAQEGKTI